MTLKQGDEAPQFHLRDQNGNGWGLGDFKDHFLVVFFDDPAREGGENRLVHAFRESYDRFKRLNTKVVGIEPQDEDAIHDLVARERLNYNLLADTELEAARLFGTLDADLGAPRRTSFLIGPDGAILKVYRDISDPSALTASILSDLKEYVREDTR